MARRLVTGVWSDDFGGQGLPVSAARPKPYNLGGQDAILRPPSAFWICWLLAAFSMKRATSLGLANYVSGRWSLSARSFWSGWGPSNGTSPLRGSSNISTGGLRGAPRQFRA